MDNIKYFLVLEKRLGDYNFIDINKLDICNSYISNEITDIDRFTKEFTEEEIRESIIRSNMAGSDYLAGELKIVSDVKHNLRVLTKDVFDEVMLLLNGSIEVDRDLKNKIFGLFKKNVEKSFTDDIIVDGVLSKFKEELRSGNIYSIFNYIGLLPYSKSRNIYFMMADEIIKKDNINIKKLEKSNDIE